MSECIFYLVPSSKWRKSPSSTLLCGMKSWDILPIHNSKLFLFHPHENQEQIMEWHINLLRYMITTFSSQKCALFKTTHFFFSICTLCSRSIFKKSVRRCPWICVWIDNQWRRKHFYHQLKLKSKKQRGQSYCKRRNWHYWNWRRN